MKELCREAVRKHLININPTQNLFERIPQLKLPGIVTEYLLYNVSLDESDDERDEEDEDVEEEDLEQSECLTM